MRAGVETMRATIETMRTDFETMRTVNETVRTMIETMRTRKKTMRAQMKTMRAGTKTWRELAETMRTPIETMRTLKKSGPYVGEGGARKASCARVQLTSAQRLAWTRTRRILREGRRGAVARRALIKHICTNAVTQYASIATRSIGSATLNSRAQPLPAPASQCRSAGCLPGLWGILPG